MKYFIELAFLLVSRLSFSQNIFPSNGNVGIGTTSPGAKLSFNNLDDGSNNADGITWYNPDPLNYGLYRTTGAWNAPNYQQLQLSFLTGIILNPGTSYGKSYVDIQGSGLRVSSGNVGIGTTSPASLLHVYSAAQYPRISVQSNSSTGAPGFDIRDPSGIPVFTWHYDIGNGFMGFFQSGVGNRMVINTSGNVGICTTSPDAKLAVSGQVHAQEVKVSVTVPGPDYVFEKDYKLTSLEEIKNYIDQNKHLPEVPSAKEMEKNGVQLGEMNMLLLKKIEELTLYVIEQNKRIDAQEKEINQLKKNKN